MSEFQTSIKLECPVTWIPNYIDKLLTYTVKKHGNTLTYLRSRLAFRPPDSTSNDVPREPELSLSSQSVSHGEEWMCRKICMGSLALYLNNEGVYSNHFKDCRMALTENNLRGSETHRKVYQYILDATDVVQEFRKRQSGNASNAKKDTTVDNPEDLRKKEEDLRKKWESLKDSPVIHFIKGQLAAVLGVVRDVSIHEFRKAAQLEPNYCLWQQMLYEILKQTRKSGSNLNSPSSEEILACQKAHDLNPKKLEYTIDLATMKLQSLQCAKAKVSKDKNYAIKESKIIIELISDVLGRARENSRFEMLAKLKKAELYCSQIEGLPQRTKEAETVFKECYMKWPKSSMVLHKVAKFYHYNSRLYSKSLQIYKEAMELSPENYPCLMDCLKLLGRHLKKYGEMVVMIDKHLPKTKDPEHIVALLIIKGQAGWVGNEKKKACDAWVEAFVNFKWLAFKMKEQLASNYSSTFGKLEISLAEMSPYFKESCKNVDISGNKFIKEFLELLEKAEQAGSGSRLATYSAEQKSSSRRERGNVVTSHHRQEKSTLFDLIAPHLNKR